MNKQKIINDPVHGFISIHHKLILQLIEHPFFQRLRRIKQLGLTDYVYPGALHTRFHHALGAYHLMGKAIHILRLKGCPINQQEALSAQIAILLHDIGHGPYSHTLERSIIKGITHEQVSKQFMLYFNQIHHGAIDMALRMFLNTYHRPFFNQLISSQLDLDRLDYLTRDSFFTGVSEGIINYNRIINMMNVVDDVLVVEEKGIYSIEKFLISRRLMYWQVYLHKTVIVANEMLVKILDRAKIYLQHKDNDTKISAPLHYFLSSDSILEQEFEKNHTLLHHFAQLDDYDIFSALKQWQHHPDPILSYLSTCIINRNLLKVEWSNIPFDHTYILGIQKKVAAKMKLPLEDIGSLVFTDAVQNYLYDTIQPNINIVYKNHKIKDIISASDHLHIDMLTKPITKYYLCYPL